MNYQKAAGLWNVHHGHCSLLNHSHCGASKPFLRVANLVHRHILFKGGWVDNSTNSKFISGILAPGLSCWSCSVCCSSSITFTRCHGLPKVTRTEISVNFRQAVFIKDAPWILARKQRDLPKAWTWGVEVFHTFLIQMICPKSGNPNFGGWIHTCAYILHPFFI